MFLYKAMRNCPLGTMNVCTKFDADASTVIVVEAFQTRLSNWGIMRETYYASVQINHVKSVEHK